MPQLTGVSNTMLWALHNRAVEALRPDSILNDPEAKRIYRSIDYDFSRHFGSPAGSLAARAAEIDRALRMWIARHPDGLIVSLGEGLETQSRRVDNGRIRWLSVDLPDAIRLRERFLPQTDRFRHIACNVLDFAWMEKVDDAAGIFIVAQGLLMYLPPASLPALLGRIAERFSTAEMVFDAVPRWFSCLTLFGLNQTPHYRLPPMPWGIDHDEVEPTLRQWMPNLESVRFLDYQIPRGLPSVMTHLVRQMPIVRHEVPTLVHVVLAPDQFASNIIPFRKKPMTPFDGVLEVASRNAASGNDLAVAAGQVIAKRMALGVAAAFNPMQADHAEFGRMVPEKMEAFSAAGRIMVHQAGQASAQLTRFTTDAFRTAARATFAMAGSPNPIALAETQRTFAVAWFEQAASNFMAMGMLALGAQEAVLVPIQETLAANTERLIGR